MMQLTTYVSFNGQCEEAFRFYERSIGAKLGEIFHAERIFNALAENGRVVMLLEKRSGQSVLVL